MLADWNAECAADDPVLVVPWSAPDPSSPDQPSPNQPSPNQFGPDQPSPDHPLPTHPGSHFVDLRDQPYELESLPEAERFPALRNALRSLNSARSPVFTAKCDSWPVTDPDHLARLHAELGVGPEFGMDLDPDLARAAHSSYIDLLWRDRSLFASRHQHEHLADRLTRRAQPLDLPFALLECTIRPALLDFTSPQEGFALTLYVHAFGTDPEHAEANWSRALDEVTLLLRSRDLVPTT